MIFVCVAFTLSKVEPQTVNEESNKESKFVDRCFCRPHKISINRAVLTCVTDLNVETSKLLARY